MLLMSSIVAEPTWTLGERLAKARTFAEMEPEDIAEALGKARTTIYNYEAGRTEPTYSTLVRWAEVCSVPMDWLTRNRCSSAPEQVFYEDIAA